MYGKALPKCEVLHKYILITNVDDLPREKRRDFIQGLNNWLLLAGGAQLPMTFTSLKLKAVN